MYNIKHQCPVCGKNRGSPKHKQKKCSKRTAEGDKQIKKLENFQAWKERCDMPFAEIEVSQIFKSDIIDWIIHADL